VITEIRPDYTAHLKDVGYSVLFTDGAAAFVHSPDAFDAADQMSYTTEDGYRTFGTPAELDGIFNILEK
jgi:hypothetical protein